MWMEKASAQRPELVQILLVAFSRRMMLLAGRQREHEAAIAVGIDGFTAEPSRHLADEFLAGGHQADIGAAEIEAVADRLALADDDIGAERAGRLDQAERHHLGHHDDQQGAGSVSRVGGSAKIAQVPVEIGGLHDNGSRPPRRCG